MKLKKMYVKRIKEYGETTLSELKISGSQKSWYILERGGPDSEIEGSKKRIKAGKYLLAHYSSPMYKDVYQLKNVPGRTSILIHSGNFFEDTSGCLLPGMGWGTKPDKNYYVTSSKMALKEVFSEINDAAQVNIIITNEFEG